MSTNVINLWFEIAIWYSGDFAPGPLKLYKFPL